MYFKLWLENIETLEEKSKLLMDIIDNNDYMTAAKKFIELGVDLDPIYLRNLEKLDHVIGHKISEAIYKFWAYDKNDTYNDPNLVDKIAAIGHQIKSSHPNLVFSDDAENASWAFFTIVNPDRSINKRADSADKLYIKVKPENLNQILDIANIIASNPSFFYQWKFYADEKFSSRRDNVVIFLSQAGVKNIENTKKLFSKYKLDSGFDWRSPINPNPRTGTLTGTDQAALKVVLRLLQKHPDFNEDKIQLTFKRSEQIFIKSLLASIPKSQTVPNPSNNYIPKEIGLRGDKNQLAFKVNGDYGGRNLRLILSPEIAKFFSEPQFRLEKTPTGWMIKPMPNTTNKTIVNGKIVANPVKINVNDKIGIQGQSGKQVVPITVTAV